MARHFGTNADGLTDDQVERLRSKYGANGESFGFGSFQGYGSLAGSVIGGVNVICRRFGASERERL